MAARGLSAPGAAAVARGLAGANGPRGAGRGSGLALSPEARANTPLGHQRVALGGRFLGDQGVAARPLRWDGAGADQDLLGGPRGSPCMITRVNSRLTRVTPRLTRVF